MNTENMENLYSIIAEKIICMLPINWEKVYLYANIDDDTSYVFFYYFLDDKQKPMYSLNIPYDNNIEKDRFNKMDDNLSTALRDLYNEFIINKMKPWTNLTFSLLKTGLFDIQYGYEDLSNVSYGEQQKMWEQLNLYR
jgi:uncharacterized protein (TIGR01741 family)